MALTTQTLILSSDTLETELNAYLATLPTDVVFDGFSFDAFIVPKRLNAKIAVTFLLNTGGVVTTPWAVKLTQASNADDFDTAIAALIATNILGFTTGARLRYLSPDNATFDQLLALTLYNPTAGAGVNWTPR
jgi:hypothetical protein